MESIKRDIFLNTFSNFLQFGTRWFLNVMLARNFSPMFYGEFILFYSLATLFSSLFAFGSNLFLLHKAREDVSILTRSVVLTISIFLTVLVIALIFFSKYLVTFLLALALALNINLFSYYKGLGWFDKEARLYLLFSFALLTAIFLTLKGLIASVDSLMILLTSINFVVFLIGLSHICTSFDCRSSTKMNIYYSIKSEFTERFTYGIHEFLSILFKNLEFVLLSIYAGNKYLGEYRAIYNLVFPFYTIATITSQVLLSRLSVSTKDRKRILLKKFTMLTSSIGVLLFIILYVTYPFILHIFYDSKFTDVTYKLTYLLMLINLLVYLIKSNFEVTLTASGKQAFRVKVLSLSIFLLVIIDFFIVRVGGILGHSAAILVVNTFILFVYLRETLKPEAK